MISLHTHAELDRLVGYQCRRNLDVGGEGMAGQQTRQCRGRMVATMHVATRTESLTCDVCGRLAAAEAATLMVTNPDGSREPWSIEWQVRDDVRAYMRRMYAGFLPEWSPEGDPS